MEDLVWRCQKMACKESIWKKMEEVKWLINAPFLFLFRCVMENAKEGINVEAIYLLASTIKLIDFRTVTTAKQNHII